MELSRIFILEALRREVQTRLVKYDRQAHRPVSCVLPLHVLKYCCTFS